MYTPKIGHFGCFRQCFFVTFLGLRFQGGIDEYESDSESDEDTSDEEGETAQADDDNNMD